MQPDEVAVIIPVYKTQFTAYELIALEQCLKVLKDHPIILIKPNSLPLPSAIHDIEKLEIISFDDEFFASIHGYNRLMLSADFYKVFLKYKFMLIHQLDAFVFSDELSYWCKQGYDYIGAPWLGKKRDLLGKLILKAKNYFYVRYNVKYKDGLPKIGKQLENRVGNGGFSLRRVEVLFNCCTSFKPEIERYLAMQHPWFNEDIFWSIEINRKKPLLRIPKLKKALQFAFETNPEIALEINDQNLPFGCHAWDKNVDFWRPIFKERRYDI